MSVSGVQQNRDVSVWGTAGQRCQCLGYSRTEMSVSGVQQDRDVSLVALTANGSGEVRPDHEAK